MNAVLISDDMIVTIIRLLDSHVMHLNHLIDKERNLFTEEQLRTERRSAWRTMFRLMRRMSKGRTIDLDF
jgi:hypothetical protein